MKIKRHPAQRLPCRMPLGNNMVAEIRRASSELFGLYSVGSIYQVRSNQNDRFVYSAFGQILDHLFGNFITDLIRVLSDVADPDLAINFVQNSFMCFGVGIKAER